MATIDLTKPEVDLIKVRLLAQQLLDLVQPNDDDAPPPPASDARVLAQQVLGAKTIPEAHALAQALIDAEDEPSAKRRRASKERASKPPCLTRRRCLAFCCSAMSFSALF